MESAGWYPRPAHESADCQRAPVSVEVVDDLVDNLSGSIDHGSKRVTMLHDQVLCNLQALLLTTMLRRVPTTNDGKVVDRLQESHRINKPFKAPASSVIVDRVQPPRKRKRVSYKDAGGDSDSDGDDPRKKKKKKGDKDGAYTEGEPVNNVQNYPVFKPKPFGEVRRFSIPGMKNKEGEEVRTIATNVSLGIRPMANIIPRPLHDPMEDHAIVLYDPTVDDRETDEDRLERLKEEAKELAAKEAKEKTVGMYNPHKSLKDLLGEGKDKKKSNKVPVVIDPRLTKVLRPHQVEGVQVSTGHSFVALVINIPPVPVQMYDRYDCRESIRVYHGGCNGLGKGMLPCMRPNMCLPGSCRPCNVLHFSGH